jgi:hypothetical protein
MDDRKWQRYAALGGVAFVVLNIVGSIAQGAPPSSDDSNEEVLKWFVDHDTGIKVSAILAAFSIIGLTWWFGSLWRQMTRAENGNPRLSIVALGGLAGAGALFAVSTSVLATVAIQVDEVGSDGAKFFNVLATTLLSFAGALIVTHLAAVNALSLRTKFLPGWVTIVGLVSAACFVVSMFGTTTDEDFVMLFGFIGFIAWAVWILGVSLHLWRTTEVASVEPADAAVTA